MIIKIIRYDLTIDPRDLKMSGEWHYRYEPNGVVINDFLGIKQGIAVIQITDDNGVPL